MTLTWKRGDAPFDYQKYPRDHTWKFAGGQEITASVLDGEHSVVLDQAENRLHMQKAILIEWLSAATKFKGKR